MPAKIKVAVDCKNVSWRWALDLVIADGNANALRDVALEGLPPGGYYRYKPQRLDSRCYLVYRTPAGKQYTIGSFDPSLADQDAHWRPSPNCSRRFEFKSGCVIVYYDAQALPFRIEAER